MRDAKITQIYEGTNQIQRVVIAKHLLVMTSRTNTEIRLRFSPAPTRLPAHRQRAHRAVQLVAGASRRRHVHPAHRGHRRRPLDRRVDRADPAGAALGRSRLGRGPVPPESSLRRVPRRRAAAARRRRRVRVLLHRGRGARAQRAGDARGPRARLRRPLPGSHPRAARRVRGRGQAPVGSLPHARRRPQHVCRRRARGSVGRVVDDLRFRDRALERYAGVLLGQRRRRRRHAHHARVARRGSHRLDASRARAAPGARSRRPARLRAYAADSRSGRREALEAARRGVGRGVPRRRLSAARARELPRAARLGPRRRPRSAHDRRVDRRVRCCPRDAVAGDVRSEEARVDERRAHSPDAARRTGRARCCRSHARATAIASTCACSNVPSRSRKSARQRSCRSRNKPRSCSFRTTSSSIDEKSWEKVLDHGARERSARRSDRVRREFASGATRSTCVRRSSTSG